MKSFFERRDRWGNGYSLWLMACVVFAIPLMVWSLMQLRMENDVAGWLPKNDPQSKILAWYQNLFPEEDRVLISWDDCTLTDPRLQALSIQLKGVEKDGVREGGSPYFSDVTQPSDLLKRIHAAGLPFETAIDRAQGLLIGKGPLCVSLTEDAQEKSEDVSRAIKKLAETQFGLSIQFVQRTLPEPNPGQLAIDDEDGWKLHDAMTRYVQQQKPADLQLTWPRMHLDSVRTESFRRALANLKVSLNDDSPCVTDSWYVPGSMAALSVSFTEVGTSDHRSAIEAIHSATEAVGIPAASLRLGGRPVASTNMNEAVKHAGWNKAAPLWNLLHRSPLLLSVLISITLSYIMLKSFRLCVLVQTVSIVSAVASVALVVPTGGSMNMVLIVMPTLLMVISVSGTIHICNYWKNSGIDDPVQSVLHAASIAWLPCLLASSTTAIGLASLIVSSLVPVRDFGFYASIGCLISFFCVLYLLPAMMLYWPARPPVQEHAVSTFWSRLGAVLSRHKALNLVANAALVMACLAGFYWFRTETKVIRYFPDQSRVVQDYNFLEENLSGIASVDTIVRFSKSHQESVPFLDRARKVLELQEALRHHSEVSGTLSLASFINLEKPNLKSMSMMDRRNARLRENVIGERIHERLRKGGREAKGVASLLAVADKPTDFETPGDEKLNRAGDEIWRITCQSSIMSDYDYGRLTRELAEIAEQHLGTFSEETPEHVVTGLVPIFLRTQQALLESLINSFGMAFVLIGIVMIFLLRNVSAALYSMIPNVFPIAIIFGMLGWGDIRIDIGTMITASVALGIAVDGTLHLITWFQQLLREGLSRDEAVSKALEHCGPALWQTSAAVGFGMLTLYPVELLLISRFGWIMCGLIFAALWGDVILLPSLLAGPLGASLEKAEQRRRMKESGGGSPKPLLRPLNPDADAPESLDLTTDENRAAYGRVNPSRYSGIAGVFPRPAADR
jgi:predicted RND superfamily exporter protein